MSASVLRDSTRALIEQRLEKVTALLVQGVLLPAEQLRALQGEARGLITSLEFLQQSYRDLH